jgi:hypothetical protein
MFKWLAKNEDLEVWIDVLEDLRFKLENICSSITDDHFVIQLMNSLTGDYELQMLLLKCLVKCVL